MSKCQTAITFEAVLMMNQKFNTVFEYTYSLYLQIILWSWGTVIKELYLYAQSKDFSDIYIDQ